MVSAFVNRLTDQWTDHPMNITVAKFCQSGTDRNSESSHDFCIGIMRFLAQSMELWSHQILRVWPWSMFMRGNTPRYLSVCLVSSPLLLILALSWSQSCVIKIIVLFIEMHHGSRLLFLIFWFKVNIYSKIHISLQNLFSKYLIE